MAAPFLFRSTQSGARTLSGTSGDLISVLSSCLIINHLFTTTNDSSFNDHTTEARLEGGTAFTLFPTPATGDRAYFGMTEKFNRLKLDLATLGVGGTYVWEYRKSDSTWATLSISDGAAGLTQDGTITFTPPSDWVTFAVNSVTQYWIRVRPTVTPSTNPTVNFATVTGWTEAFTGTNKRVYKQGGGNSFFLRVQDDAPGAGGAREARVVGGETATDVDTLGNMFPTAAQHANGIFVRKSASADATTRTWAVIADDRTFYMFVLTTDTANAYLGWMFGDVESFVPGDSFRTMIIARTTENSSSAGAENLDRKSGFGTAITAGHFMARQTDGTGTSKTYGKDGGVTNVADATFLRGIVTYPNPADGGLYIAPLYLHEGTVTTLRGRLRGFHHFMHAITGVADGDIFQIGSRTFVILKQSQNAGLYVLETSDTWNTN